MKTSWFKVMLNDCWVLYFAKSFKRFTKYNKQNKNALSARKAIEFGVGPKPIATREHREQIYRRFPA